MTDQIDGRRRRGMVRRAAYREAARTLKLATLEVPKEANDARLVELYFSERARLIEWLVERAGGRLIAPPGGIKERA